MITDVCQRWNARRPSWRPAGEVFDARAHEVAAIASDRVVADYVEANHYSGTMPAARRRFGLYRGARLVGAAVFSAPMQSAVLRPWSMTDAMELGRLVLDDAVAANAESWFVARCFELLHPEGLAGAVSFSDPEPRTDSLGARVFVGHIGTVYQALNAVYTGRGSPRSMRLLPDGREFSNRAASKIRGRERGWEYAVAQLVAAGAREPGVGADLRAWLSLELQRVTRVQRHQGNHRYAWPFTASARRDLARIGHGRSLAYPKFTLRTCGLRPSGDTCARAA